MTHGTSRAAMISILANGRHCSSLPLWRRRRRREALVRNHPPTTQQNAPIRSYILPPPILPPFSLYPPPFYPFLPSSLHYHTISRLSHHHGELAYGSAGGNGVGALLDQVCRVEADDVDAHDLFRLLVEQHLSAQVCFEGVVCKGNTRCVSSHGSPPHRGGRKVCALFIDLDFHFKYTPSTSNDHEVWLAQQQETGKTLKAFRGVFVWKESFPWCFCFIYHNPVDCPHGPGQTRYPAT